jgi:hypothetical protein
MIDDATPYRVSAHGPGYDGEVFARFFSRERAEDECRTWVKAPPGCQAKLDGPDADLPMSVAGSGSRSAQAPQAPSVLLRGIATDQAPSVDPSAVERKLCQVSGSGFAPRHLLQIAAALRQIDAEILSLCLRLSQPHAP